MRPDQIISLLELGGPTFAMADHADHIHVGFRPLFGANTKLGRQALAVLKPGQWSDLLARLREIDNPVVPDQAVASTRSRRQARSGQATPTRANSRSPPGAPFGFVQLEFGFLLGPARRPLPRCGRRRDAEPERVLVLRTLGAPAAAAARGPPRPERRARPRPSPCRPAARPWSRAQPFESQGEAEAWLDGPAGRRRAGRGRGRRRRARPQRRAAAPTAPPPPTRTRATCRAGQALVVRIGYGAGEEVADGRFSDAWELPRERAASHAARWRRPRSASRRCSAAASAPLACEELVLRARADLDAGRPREAALQARIALEALLAELPADRSLEERPRRRSARPPTRRSAATRRRSCRRRWRRASARMEAVARAGCASSADEFTDLLHPVDSGRANLCANRSVGAPREETGRWRT